MDTLQRLIFIEFSFYQNLKEESNTQTDSPWQNKVINDVPIRARSIRLIPVRQPIIAPARSPRCDRVGVEHVKDIHHEAKSVFLSEHERLFQTKIKIHSGIISPGAFGLSKKCDSSLIELGDDFLCPGVSADVAEVCVKPDITRQDVCSLYL